MGWGTKKDGESCPLDGRQTKMTARAARQPVYGTDSTGSPATTNGPQYHPCYGLRRMLLKEIYRGKQNGVPLHIAHLRTTPLYTGTILVVNGLDLGELDQTRAVTRFLPGKTNY